MGKNWENVNMLTHVPADTLEDIRIRKDKMDYEYKVKVINELSEFEYDHEEYELVNQLESCLIQARFHLMRGEKVEAEELLDKTLRCY